MSFVAAGFGCLGLVVIVRLSVRGEFHVSRVHGGLIVYVGKSLSHTVFCYVRSAEDPKPLNPQTEGRMPRHSGLQKGGGSGVTRA